MKILITGGCGFVGTNVAIFLNKKYKVDCLDNLSRKGSKYNLEILKKNRIRNFNIDIENFNQLKKLPKYEVTFKYKQNLKKKTEELIKRYNFKFKKDKYTSIFE